jgi:tetratricopeptide (TPR) repeat protein
MATIQDVSSMAVTFTNWKKARDTLKDFRETGKRESAATVSLGRVLLKDYSGKLGDEVWVIHEQVLTAALDTGDIKLAEKSLKCLQDRFSKNSARVKRLEGLIMEGKEEFEEALVYYDELLKDNPSDTLVIKRKIAIYKAQGEMAMAIDQLVELLEMTMADYESWSELADLYITQHQYDKAAFCLEELILSNPHNYVYHQQYAEVCYTQNTLESLEIARKYYCASLKLNPSNLRSLYGLYQTSVKLAKHPKAKKESKIKNEDMAKWTASQLLELYQVILHIM